MIITHQYVRDKFYEYNELMFEGKLPPIPIKIGTSRGRLGTCFYTVLRRPGQKPVNAFFHLRFSSAFDLPEEEWEDTIIHELIHYYLAFFEMNDKTPHGENFKRMMKDINARFGRHVSISYRPPKNGENVPKYRFAVVRDRRGQTGIKRFGEGSYVDFVQCMEERCGEGSVTVYESSNPFFGKLSINDLMSCVLINEDALMKHLDDGQYETLICEEE